MNFNNDEYTLNLDDLGDTTEVKDIRKLILEAKTPFSIGISGRWGSGKTSVMKHLMASVGGKPTEHVINFSSVALEKIDDYTTIAKKYAWDEQKYPYVHTIWFNPWEYEHHAEPMVGLLQEIHTHFSTYIKSKNKITKLATITIQSGLDMLGSYLKIGKNVATNIKTIGENYEKENFLSIDRNLKFKMAFYEAIKLLLLNKDIDSKDDITTNEHKENARVIIFIDDLDRCEDATISTLLKEIKQYLATKHCVFVFGYDRQQIEKSLSKTEVNTAKDARVYLEKLFQATFYIKAPKVEQIEKYVIAHLKMTITAHWYRHDFIPFLCEMMDPNPRRIKRYLTAVYFHLQHAEEKTFEAYKKFALMAYLKFFYEPVYSALENKHDMLDAITEVCNNKDMSTVDNKEQYFVYLEFLSHFDKTNETEFLNVDLRKKIISHTEIGQNKFLEEVYYMQGKHTSFNRFKRAFYEAFNDEKHIERYI